MTARAEIEEILEAQVWADRNGLDRSIVANPRPAAERLAEYERKQFRDCPAWDAYDHLPVVPAKWVIIGALVVATTALIWGLSAGLGS